MSRIRAVAAVTALGAFLLAGIGTAQADNGAGSENHSNGSVVSSVGSGNVVGGVHGNADGSQQSATGSGGGNQNNSAGVAGNAGAVGALQGNGGLAAKVYYPFVLY
ncbi:hypothetical protein GCM10010495_13420 [Kitasatospora herbaricolor]|uniref:hypothetical protein n=1 Tax=Kitasatospora herbaricolor TaxID=68217 RepID=UPI00174B05DC|nr:hypothetical protein [Kitasatospora herbaricolor]MDQ0309151.1 hypothetical protein [Kitasatospora herbaricolor]GGV03355.1 hypothetical protein GCM10010495_13420 [Kitasatospora herbaricolor]